MKYITRNINNLITLKLNSTPVNPYSGKYIFNCTHILTNQILTLILQDQSPQPNTYQQFLISSGDSNNFLVGQYSVNIADFSASTVTIATEYFTARQSTVDDSIYFLPNSDTADVYQQTSTSIPAIPIGLTATLLSSGIDIQLKWDLGSTNTDSFELWRRNASTGSSFGLATGIQYLTYVDRALPLNKTFIYKIRAKNDIGFSGFSPEVSATTSISGQTGSTLITLIGSGETKTTPVGSSTWIIYSPSAQTSSNIYSGATPAAITVGGIVAGEVLTGKTFTELFQDLLVPTLFPMIVAPSGIMTRYISPNAFYEINENLTIEFEQDFNRGSITPAYGTNGYRSGVPIAYYYNGAGLPLWILSNAMSDAQVISNYHALIGINSWNGHVEYSAGQQPKDSKGNNYLSPLPQGVTTMQVCSFEGVYPVFANTVLINNQTQQPLVSMLNGNNFVYSLAAETMGFKQRFEMSSQWLTARPIVGIQTFNTVSNAWEFQGGTAGTSLSYWTQTSIVISVQGLNVNYTIFTYNGTDRSAAQIKIILT
jgi:hypothetical protein